MVGKPLVEASMTGFNSILMAYGQTGAGTLFFLVLKILTAQKNER